jgi:serine/threonine-protein kinase
MDRLVLLKTIVLGPETDQKNLRRFLREAKTGGRLSHPSIVELYDVNEQSDLMYIVMEFVEGQTLDQMLKARNGPLPGVDVVRWMVQIADALAYAHEQSIIHRDIKPATIVVRREDNRAKLSDFTLAKNLERAGVSVITADGEAVGTPYYLAPEQVKSAKAADARSDVYAYGAAFYHCLTNQLPIPARSYGEFIARVFTTPPVPVQQIFPSVPAPLAALLEKCLAKDPGQRFQQMTELQEALAPVARAVGAG